MCARLPSLTAILNLPTVLAARRTVSTILAPASASAPPPSRNGFTSCGFGFRLTS